MSSLFKNANWDSIDKIGGAIEAGATLASLVAILTAMSDEDIEQWDNTMLVSMLNAKKGQQQLPYAEVHALGGACRGPLSSAVAPQAAVHRHWWVGGFVGLRRTLGSYGS